MAAENREATNVSQRRSQICFDLSVTRVLEALANTIGKEAKGNGDDQDHNQHLKKGKTLLSLMVSAYHHYSQLPKSALYPSPPGCPSLP